MWRVVDGKTEEELLEIVDGLAKPVFVLASGKQLASTIAKRLTESGFKTEKLAQGIAEDDDQGHAHRMDGIDALVLSFNALLPAEASSDAQGMCYKVAPPLLLPLTQAAQLVVFGAQNFKCDYVEELAEVAIGKNPNIDIVLFIYGEGEKVDKRYEKFMENAIPTPSDEEGDDQEGDEQEESARADYATMQDS